MKRMNERGFTLIEIMIVVAIVALLAAIAIPNVIRGRTTANETAAIQNLRALMSSLEMYRSVNAEYPDNGAGAYRADMYTNANPDYGPPSFDLALTGQSVQGFNYTYTGVAGGATYDLEADPTTIGTTGTRSFHADETGIVRHCLCAVAACANPTWANESSTDAAPSNCA